MTPNVSSYTAVISAWAKSGARETVDRVERLLLDMERSDTGSVAPNVMSYSTVLNALAKSKDPSSMERSMRILQRMENEQFDVRPNSYCYASAMECISTSPNKKMICDHALTLLRRMTDYQSVDKNDQNKNESFTVVFNTAIKAVERSGERRKDQVAFHFLTMMKECHKDGILNAPPSVRTYNAFIRSCAFTDGGRNERSEAFNTAVEALEEMRALEGVELDMYTYPAAFRACQELLLINCEEDLERMRNIFESCCEDGLVDALVLKNMSNFLPQAFMMSLLRTRKVPASVRLKDLPHSWRRNIYSAKHSGRKTRLRNRTK